MNKDLSLENPVVSAQQFKRSLGALDLIMLGIGAVIGSGIFIVTGMAAATKSGPAVTISFIIAGFASLLTALAYAELSSSVGGCGGAYNYALQGFGKFIAWMVGWDLLFEYGIGAGLLAIGWSGYFTNILTNLGIHFPEAFLHAPSEGGIINLPAIIIVLFLASILLLGTKKSVRFNAVLVMTKLLTIGLFIGVAIYHIQPANWVPFLPFGWMGVIQGAALTFNAFIGFDVIAMTAEETVNPKRNLPLAIIITFIICASLYILVAAILTGIVSYQTLDNASPVSSALQSIHMPWVAAVIGSGAIVSITTVLLAFIYSLTRVSFAMSRDGFLPATFSKLSKKRHTPTKNILIAALVVCCLAGFVSLNSAVQLVNISTLAVFILVCLGVVVLRFKQPDLERPFKAPLFVSILGTIICSYLMINLSLDTWLRFSAWLALGVGIYFFRTIMVNKVIQTESNTI